MMDLWSGKVQCNDKIWCQNLPSPQPRKRGSVTFWMKRCHLLKSGWIPFSPDVAKWIWQAQVYHSLLWNVRGVAATVEIFNSQHTKWVSNHPLLSIWLPAWHHHLFKQHLHITFFRWLFTLFGRTQPYLDNSHKHLCQRTSCSDSDAITWTYPSCPIGRLHCSNCHHALHSLSTSATLELILQGVG